MNNGAWPADNGAAGLATMSSITGRYTVQVEVVNNVIQIEYGAAAHGAISGEQVTLTAADNLGSVSWTCASAGAIANKYLPSACR